MCYESVLIYCNNGQNRSLAVIVCYLMRRFRWNLKKTLGYLESKRNDLEIKQNYFKCLQSIADEFVRSVPTSSSWDNFQSPREYREEEILLTNTHLNAQKARFERDLSSIIGNQPKHRSFERKVKKTVKWADKLKREKVKAKSTQKSNKINTSIKSKTIKLANNLKSKCRFNNVKTEFDDSYDEPYIKKCIDKKKFQLSNSSEFYQKSMKQIQMKILGNHNNEKNTKNIFNNSFSKSTNAQEDSANLEKNETSEGKLAMFKMIKEGTIANKKNKQLKDSFFKDMKFLKVNKRENVESETEIDKCTQRSINQCKSNRVTDNNSGNLFNKNLDQVMREKMFKARALRFDLGRFEEGRTSHKSESVNPKTAINLSKAENLQFDSKTDNNYVKTQNVMKRLLEQKNPSFNISIDPDKQSQVLKSNKNSDIFYNKNDDGHKRPSSAPNKGKLNR